MLPSLFIPDQGRPFGRNKIISKYDAITPSNILDAFNAALSTHEVNSAAIEALYAYYRGVTPILNKVKEYRQEVNNRVGVSTAQEIVSFYVGYVFGNPKSYVRHDGRNDIADRIEELNDWARMAGIPSCDIELVTWALICGTSYRSVAVNEQHPDETPFRAFSVDPRNAFVAYDRIDNKTPVFCAVSSQMPDGGEEWVVSTDKEYYIVRDGSIVSRGRNWLGTLPIIEYPANAMRIGVFEAVIDQLNALETLQSCRVDATVQDVDNVLTIIGADPGETDAEGNTVKDWLQKLKMLVLPAGSDAKYITAPLKQADAQTLVDSVYRSIVTITGIPNRNGGTSTSDTGTAVYLRDGHHAAETRAEQIETCFRDAEVLFLRAVMSIAEIQQRQTVRVADIDVKFARRYSENILVRAQALKNLLDSGIGPEDAIAAVSICSDPLDVALRNKERIDKVLFGGEDTGA